MCCCRACATKGVLLLGRLVLSLQGGLTFGGVLLLGRGLTLGGGGLSGQRSQSIAVCNDWAFFMHGGFPPKTTQNIAPLRGSLKDSRIFT